MVNFHAGNCFGGWREYSHLTEKFARIYFVSLEFITLAILFSHDGGKVSCSRKRKGKQLLEEWL
jgi:hypothetical protein